MNDTRVGLFFIDGLGLGEDDPLTNPLAPGHDGFAELIGGPLIKDYVGEGIDAPYTVVVPTDALLGVAGLPQSATGQTSLLTGINAQARIGRHLNGFPSPALSEILQESGIFRRYAMIKQKAVFANAFTPEYFHGVYQRKWRLSATTVAALAGDQPLKEVDDLRRGSAVYQDMTREHFIERGYGIHTVEPAQAGRDFARLIQENDFTLYEYFQTDRCGHKQNREWAARILDHFSEFLHGLFSILDPRNDLLIITSDHGNFEAMDRKTHTMNPVPTIAWGYGAKHFRQVKGLTDIVPIIINEVLSN